MLKDKADFVTLALFVGGVALILGGAFGWAVPPQFMVYIIMGGIGATLALSGYRHLDLNRREKWEVIERTKQETSALWLANLERERKLAAATPAPKAPPADYRQQWVEACARFVAWGDAYGFTIRRLAVPDSPGYCVSWEDWRLMVDVLADLGVLNADGNRTRWADGWNAARWEQARASLPYPTDRPAPQVAVPVLGNTNNAPNTPLGAVGGSAD